MAKYLLDTTEVIQILRGDTNKKKLFEELIEKEGILGCCGITVGEVYYGMKESETRWTEAFFEGIEYYPISIEAAKLAGKWRKEYQKKGYMLTLNDTLIAAVCFFENAILLTDNKKHYPMREIKVLERLS
ncbi:MAG: PIN domain-containing protein [Actinobacteria bacterium]|nr:PIN domain-containing protein [Actinomycetota bacterium]